MKFRALRTVVSIAMALVSIGGLTEVSAGDSNQAQSAINEIWQRAQAITLPEVNLKEATLSQLVGFLSKETEKFSPDNKEIRFFIDFSRPTLSIPVSADPDVRQHIQKLYDRACQCDPQTNRTVAVSLRNVPLIDCIRYVAALFDMQMHVRSNGIELGCPRFVARVYKLRPEFFDKKDASALPEIFFEPGPFRTPPRSEVLSNRNLLLIVNTEEMTEVFEKVSNFSKYVDSRME
jgi:hypothetical protein